MNVQIFILAWLSLVSIFLIMQERELGTLRKKVKHEDPVVKRYRYKDPDYRKKYNKSHKLALDHNTGAKRWVKNSKCHRELNTKSGKEIWVVNA